MSFEIICQLSQWLVLLILWMPETEFPWWSIEIRALESDIDSNIEKEYYSINLEK